MTKNQKYGIIAAVVVVVVALGAVLVGQSDTLQGWLKLRPANTITKNFGGYKYGNKYVTPVVSPVTSIVLSTVTSPSSPSLVASAVTSPVASAVPVPGGMPSTINPATVPTLTAQVLKDAARQDYLKNPKRYTLSQSQKQQLVQQYWRAHPKR